MKKARNEDVYFRATKEEKETLKYVAELYIEFGRTEVTVAASQILDRYIVEEQRRRLECLNK